jgi:hypothetical protein
MKITIADVLTSAFLITFFGALILGLKSCEDSSKAEIRACVGNPNRETCSACADNLGKSSDICRSILAGIIVEEKRK